MAKISPFQEGQSHIGWFGLQELSIEQQVFPDKVAMEIHAGGANFIEDIYNFEPWET